MQNQIPPAHPGDVDDLIFAGQISTTVSER